MIKRLTPLKLVLLNLLTTAFAVAAYFGFRCPAQGCPACRMAGH